MSASRSSWANLTDAQLLRQCEMDTYRVSGPGGQKRNKTSSAVRLRHSPSGLIVIATESRSQHENRARALRRLRQALYLEVREPPPVGDQTAGALPCGPGFRLDLGRKDPRFWPSVGVALDALQAAQGRVSQAAAALGTSTGKLVGFLQTDPKVWQQVNRLRARFGQKPLLA